MTIRIDQLLATTTVGTKIPTAAADSTAGNAFTVFASDAIAGTTNAGAAAGGTLTLHGGDAKRLTSGNANGGDILMLPGALIGAGTDGKVLVRQPGGVAGTDEGQLYHDGTQFVISTPDGPIFMSAPNTGASNDILDVRDTAGNFFFGVGSGGAQIGVRTAINQLIPGSASTSDCFSIQSSGTIGKIFLGTTSSGHGYFLRAPNASPGVGAIDTGLQRAAAGVWAALDNSAAACWVQNTAGRSRVTTSAVTNNTITPANITGLSATVIAGRKYSGRVILHCSTDQAAEGARFDFDGGNATWTSFRAAIVSNIQGATLSVTVSAAIATDLIATALSGTGVNCIVIEFSGVVNAAGTLIPRAAQSTHASGTLSVNVDSVMLMEDVP